MPRNRVAPPASNRSLLLPLILVALLAASGAVRAQTTWVVRSLPQADLWYAALGQIPFEGFSGLPLYDADYARRLRDAKRAGGITTALDRAVAEFRTAFVRDSAFEILHFVPIYFVGTDRAGMMVALRTVASGRDPTRVADPRARFGAAVVSAVLSTREQRAVLGRFVDAVEDEWQQFYGRWWSDAAGEIGREADRVQLIWDRDVSPRLGPFLAAQALDSGLILVSPALGPEGRVFSARPENRADNVIAVRLSPGSAGAAAAAVSVAREACYPVASQIVAARGGADRLAAERTSSRLAVRCGALLLEGGAADRQADYARAYAGDRPLAETFPVPADLLSALRLRLPAH